MIAAGGYRSAFVFWGVVQGLVVVAAAQVVRRPPTGLVAPGVPGRLAQATRSFTPRQMLATGRFWVMYVMMALVAFGGLMVTAQLKPIAHGYGLDRGVLVFALSALSLALILDRVLNGLTRPFWGWVSDHIGRENTMAAAFAAEAAAIVLLLNFVGRPVWFVVLTGLTFFAWGEIFSLFPATIGDVFGPDYAATNYGIEYTAKGVASIFAGWGAARILELSGSWMPVFWIAVVCDLAAAGLALLWLKPLVAQAVARPPVEGKPVGIAAA